MANRPTAAAGRRSRRRPSSPIRSSRAPAAGRRSSSPRNPRRRAAGPSAAVGSPGCARGGRCSRQRPSSQSDQPAPKSSRPGRGCQAGRRGSRPPPAVARVMAADDALYEATRDGRNRVCLVPRYPWRRRCGAAPDPAPRLARQTPWLPCDSRRPAEAPTCSTSTRSPAAPRSPSGARSRRWASSTTPSTSSRSSARVRPASARSTRGGTCPAICDGETEVYETGACLLYLAERFPAAALEPPPGDPSRGAYLRWLVWLSDTFRPLWKRIMAPQFFTTADTGGRAREGAGGAGGGRGRPSRPSCAAAPGASATATPSPTSTSTCWSAGSTTCRACGSAATPCRSTTRGSASGRRSPGRASSTTSTSGFCATIPSCAAGVRVDAPVVDLDSFRGRPASEWRSSLRARA